MNGFSKLQKHMEGKLKRYTKCLKIQIAVKKN
jgi:hypothetical protein